VHPIDGTSFVHSTATALHRPHLTVPATRGSHHEEATHRRRRRHHRPDPRRRPDGRRPGKPGDANIVEIAVANGSFTTLIAAASCTPGIVDALTGDDKLTVFAPTDDAFAGLGLNAGNVCDVFDTAALGEILTYHVTDGRRFSNSVFNKNNSKSISMLNGGTVVSNPGLTLTDQLDRPSTSLARTSTPATA
jgi:uncharacterized surface protein with fasciclin (FAS1) repeats